jgi:hypothetical protein
MKNSRRDTPIHHAPYMRSNHKLLFKGSNDFQGKITLPSSKEGQNLQSREATTSNFKGGLNPLSFPLPSTQEYIRDNKPLHQNITINKI